jgi:hypothetical protein
MDLTENDLSSHLLKPFLEQFESLQSLTVDDSFQSELYEKLKTGEIECPNLQRINGYYFRSNNYEIPSE